MLPKNSRLTTKLFDEVIAFGTMFHSPVLSLRAIKVNNKGSDNKNEKDEKNARGKNKRTEIEKKTQTKTKSRFSVVAPKKYFKTAVLRNKLRRKTYIALSSVVSLLDVDGMTDVIHSHSRIFYCVITLKPPAEKLDQANLAKAVYEIFVKSRIIT